MMLPLQLKQLTLQGLVRKGKVTLSLNPEAQSNGVTFEEQVPKMLVLMA